MASSDKMFDMAKIRRCPLYKLSIGNCYCRNIFMFIPSLFISIGRLSLYFSAKWFRVEVLLHLCYDCRKPSNSGFFILPYFCLYHLDKRYKEKWDFQFSWLWVQWRKFIGERESYETSVKEAADEWKRMQEEARTRAE